MLTEPYDAGGNPFGVFCSNPDCGNYLTPEAHPLWSEDCPVKDGILVCPACDSPMMRPE